MERCRRERLQCGRSRVVVVVAAAVAEGVGTDAAAAEGMTEIETEIETETAVAVLIADVATTEIETEIEIAGTMTVIVTAIAIAIEEKMIVIAIAIGTAIAEKKTAIATAIVEMMIAIEIVIVTAIVETMTATGIAIVERTIAIGIVIVEMMTENEETIVNVNAHDQKMHPNAATAMIHLGSPQERILVVAVGDRPSLLLQKTSLGRLPLHLQAIQIARHGSHHLVLHQLRAVHHQVSVPLRDLHRHQPSQHSSLRLDTQHPHLDTPLHRQVMPHHQVALLALHHLASPHHQWASHLQEECRHSTS
mmetsp:Transcript_119764/g.187044  ORF Transcript_119764/g.187044 Transcript_119764/m.187044 type:complete len:306 (-) Transcript_119764:292-1209(-)